MNGWSKTFKLDGSDDDEIKTFVEANVGKQIHITNKEIERLKAKVKPQISDAEFIKTLNWLENVELHDIAEIIRQLRARTDAAETRATELEGKFERTMELLGAQTKHREAAEKERDEALKPATEIEIEDADDEHDDMGCTTVYNETSHGVYVDTEGYLTRKRAATIINAFLAHRRSRPTSDQQTESK